MVCANPILPKHSNRRRFPASAGRVHHPKRTSSDALMRRYAMEDSSGVTYFIWDKDGLNLLAEKDSAGNVTAEYIHGYSPIAGIGTMVAAKKLSGTTAYYQYPHYDHRGSVSTLTDKSGDVVASYLYDAWGNLLNATESAETEVVGNRFKYQSNWMTLKDSGGTVCLSPTRLYVPGIGRFLQKDKKREGINWYVYAGNNPLIFMDPNGLSKTPFNDGLWVTGLPKNIEAYQAALERALKEGASKAHLSKLRGGIKVLKRLVKQRGRNMAANEFLAVPAVGAGLLVGDVAVAIGDEFNMFSDDEPEWTVTETGAMSCPSDMNRIATSIVVVHSFGIADIEGLLWGFGGHANPLYWVTKSASITYSCCCNIPKPEDAVINKEYIERQIPEKSYLYGLAGKTSGTLYFTRVKISSKCTNK